MNKKLAHSISLSALAFATAACGGSTDDPVRGSGGASGSGTGGDPISMGTGGNVGEGSGGAPDEDCGWSPVPDVACEDFVGMEPGVVIEGAHQSQICLDIDTIVESLAMRGIGFETDPEGTAGAGGEEGAGNGCPSSELLFPAGITYGGGCGSFDFVLCDGAPERRDSLCCYPTLAAGFTGCCG